MKTYKELKDKLCEELDEITHEIVRKSGLNEKELETVHNLIDSMYKIYILEEEDGYSGNGEWQAYGSYDSDGRSMRGRSRDGRNMDGGYSGRNRHYVKGHYSYDDAKKRMYHELGEAAEMATTDREREIINRAMRELENA